MNGLKQGGVSILNQILQIHECTKKILSTTMLSTTSFMELKTSLIIMEHENILGILCFSYFSSNQSTELIEKNLYILQNEVNDNRSLLKKFEKMLMCGYTVNIHDNKYTW